MCEWTRKTLVGNRDDDCDFDQPERGTLPFGTLERLLNLAPARTRIVLIDTCHAGDHTAARRGD